jgi:hypothetical protein
MRLFALALVALTLASPLAHAAPGADLWPRWQAHDENATATIDHGRLNAFLQKYVVVHENAPNGVRYAAVSAADHESLDAYLEAMQAIDIAAYNRDEQRAYWVNLYNAETLDLVIERYPLDSIREIGSGLFSSGPWKMKLLEVDGEKLSLNDIEHRILRPIWRDGLTHYGVNCASISCPGLRATAYTGANLYSALRTNARDYVNSAQGVRIENGEVTVSRIYDWYAADFGRSERAVVSHLRRYADPALSARLDMLNAIDDYAYDWALNDEKNLDADR